MKNFLLLLYLLFTFNLVNAQDPYSRLKTAAKNSGIEKSQLAEVKIQRNNADWIPVNKGSIQFRPFELKDRNGSPIPPDNRVTLKNGKTISAKQYIDKLNEIEQKLNEQGHTLRSKTPVLVSKTVTGNQFLSGNEVSLPEPVTQLKSGTRTEVKPFMNPCPKVGSLILKPFDEYTEEEKDLFSSYTFLKSGAGRISGRKNDGPIKIAETVKPKGPAKVLKTIEEFTSRSWAYGSPSTFKVSVAASVKNLAKIYPFQPRNPEKSKSEFEASAKASISGVLFNRSFDILIGSIELFALADTSKKMSAKINISSAGVTLYNFSRDYRQSASFSNVYGKEFDKSIAIEIPIVQGIYFSGKIGVRGRSGFEYVGTLNRNFAGVIGNPVAEIEGYAEASQEFLEIVPLGAGKTGGKLTFLKGSLGLNAFAGICMQNAGQIVFTVGHLLDFDLEMLRGSLYCSIEVCTWDRTGCWSPLKHEFFNWSGYQGSGTVAEKKSTYIVENIWESE